MVKPRCEWSSAAVPVVFRQWVGQAVCFVRLCVLLLRVGRSLRHRTFRVWNVPRHAQSNLTFGVQTFQPGRKCGNASEPYLRTAADKYHFGIGVWRKIRRNGPEIVTLSPGLSYSWCRTTFVPEGASGTRGGGVAIRTFSIVMPFSSGYGASRVGTQIGSSTLEMYCLELYLSQSSWGILWECQSLSLGNGVPAGLHFECSFRRGRGLLRLRECQAWVL